MLPVCRLSIFFRLRRILDPVLVGAHPIRLILDQTRCRMAHTQTPSDTDQSNKVIVSTSSGPGTTKPDTDKVSITFLKPDGSKITVKTSVGKSLYDSVIDNNVDIDGFGACEGTLCCTTCHLYFSEAEFKKVGEPTDEELDMLDLAYNLTETSRLGCQVKLTKNLDPLEVHVPVGINDIREC